jgi:hypothetical protein
MHAGLKGKLTAVDSCKAPEKATKRSDVTSNTPASSCRRPTADMVCISLSHCNISQLHAVHESYQSISLIYACAIQTSPDARCRRLSFRSLLARMHSYLVCCAAPIDAGVLQGWPVGVDHHSSHHACFALFRYQVVQRKGRGRMSAHQPRTMAQLPSAAHAAADVVWADAKARKCCLHQWPSVFAWISGFCCCLLLMQ